MNKRKAITILTAVHIETHLFEFNAYKKAKFMVITTETISTAVLTYIDISPTITYQY